MNHSTDQKTSPYNIIDNNIDPMLGKYYNPTDEFGRTLLNNTKNTSNNYLKNRRTFDQQKKLYQRRLFGQHFNYSKVGLNKQKKYLIEEQKNTQIERANRILLQKIKKISQRSIYPLPKNRNHTQIIDEDPQEEKLSTKMSQFHSRKETPIKETPKSGLTTPAQLRSTSRVTRPQRRILLQGQREIEGRMVYISTFIQNGKYVIYSQQEKMQHRIQMDIANYKVLLRESLDGDHNNIVSLLRFNGNLLELIGGKRQQVTIVQEEELELPSLNLTQAYQSKTRSNTN